MTYTQLSLIGVAFAIIMDLFILKTHLLRRRGFWTAYAIVIFFQLITNAWLTNDVRTGTAIVNYNPEKISGLRIAYAPVEDLFFGFAMVLLTLTFWISRGRAARSDSSSPSRQRHR